MKQLQLKKTDLNSVSPDATVIFANNKPKNEYDACTLSHLNHFEIKVEVVNFLRDIMPIYLQTSLSSRSCSAAAGLPLSLKLKWSMCNDHIVYWFNCKFFNN